MFLNFTSSSLTILFIFYGMGLVAFFMSVPYLMSKEELRSESKKD